MNNLPTFYTAADVYLFPKATGIYCIEHVASGRKYVGKTERETGFRVRWQEHLAQLKANQHFNQYLQRAFTKYGEEAFRFQVLEIVADKFEERETYYIESLQTFIHQHGYNARHPLTLTYPPQVRAQMSRAHLGFKHTEESIERMRAVKLGKARATNTREKISRALCKSRYKLINNSTGEVFDGYNLSAFAKERGFTRGGMSKLINGKLNSYHDWIFIGRE